MHFSLYCLIALLPFMGLSLNAADACTCEHGDTKSASENAIQSTSCCADLPEPCSRTCCMQKLPEPNPVSAHWLLAANNAPFSHQFICLATLLEPQLSHRDQGWYHVFPARPPPAYHSEQRSRIQSWLN